MVLLYLTREYTGFGNVKYSRFAHREGLLGEVRLNRNGLIQHKPYPPANPIKRDLINIMYMDSLRSRITGDCFRFISVDDTEFWLRFPNEHDVAVFFRAVINRIEVIMDAEEGGYTAGGFSGEDSASSDGDTRVANAAVRYQCPHTNGQLLPPDLLYPPELRLEASLPPSESPPLRSNNRRYRSRTRRRR